MFYDDIHRLIFCLIDVLCHKIKSYLSLMLPEFYVFFDLKYLRIFIRKELNVQISRDKSETSANGTAQ